MFEDPQHLLLGCLGAFLTGVTKTGLPGLGVVIAPLMAFAVPPKESVGLLVLLLLTGDCFALFYYRHHAQLTLLKRLVPHVALGICAGAAVLAYLDNETFRPVLGALISCLVLLELARRRFDLTQLASRTSLAALVGFLAGVFTTVGNSAGPIMSLYLLLMALPKHQFMGTAAWFFFCVNSSKIPFYLYLDVINPDTLASAATLAPLTILGALAGFRLLKIVPQKLFDELILVFAALAAAWLILGDYFSGRPFPDRSAYILGLGAASAIRLPYAGLYKRRMHKDPLRQGFDSFVMLLVVCGMFLLPLLFLFTDLLAFADYQLPQAAGCWGAVVFVPALWLLWRSHRDLGANWSPTVERRRDHNLVTHGVYNRVRHPMYTAHFLWGLAQLLLLENWIAGPSLLASFTLLYLTRVRKEERLMLSLFGDEYRRYAERSGRLMPPLSLPGKQR